MKEIKKLNGNERSAISGGVVGLCSCNDSKESIYTTPTGCAELCCYSTDDIFTFDELHFNCDSYVRMSSRLEIDFSSPATSPTIKHIPLASLRR